MPEISANEAITRARARSNVAAAIPAHAWRVRRLDRSGEAYFLVVLGADRAAVAVVTVDAAQGEIQSWANLPGLNPHLALQEQEAIARAGAEPDARADLVWKPCRATYSPLYPLWEIRTPAQTVYVDQQGVVWSDLPAGGPGG